MKQQASAQTAKGNKHRKKPCLSLTMSSGTLQVPAKRSRRKCAYDVFRDEFKVGRAGHRCSIVDPGFLKEQAEEWAEVQQDPVRLQRLQAEAEWRNANPLSCHAGDRF